jgi:hypothetical protein
MLLPNLHKLSLAPSVADVGVGAGADKDKMDDILYKNRN